MNRVRSHYQGYTIVETMIFLAVTSVLFVSVMLLVGGQQNKTQFTQSIQQIDGKIQDVINDVSTGYYNNTNNFKCSVSIAGQVQIIAGTNTQGTNKDCIFVGRVVQFTNGSTYNTYTMVGRRIVASTNQEVTGLYQAHAVPLDTGTSTNPGFPSATDINTLDSGLTVTKMYYTDALLAKHDIGSVGFFTRFAQYGSGVGISSGTTTTDLLPIFYPSSPSDITRSRPQMVDDIVNYLNPFPAPPPATIAPPEINPAGGVTICFKSAGTEQYGVLTIGGSGRQLTTKVDILNSATAVPPLPAIGVCSP